MNKNKEYQNIFESTQQLLTSGRKYYPINVECQIFDLIMVRMWRVRYVSCTPRLTSLGFVEENKVTFSATS